LVSSRIRWSLVLLVLVPACQGRLESVAETPPPTQGPAVSPQAALRPFYAIGPKAPQAAGTAFVVQDRAGRAYMLTASHVMDNEAEWRQVRSVSLHALGGGETAQVQGRPLFIGKPFDTGSAGGDLVIWPLAAGAKITALKLAAEDAKKNEWVWVLGQEPGRTTPQRIFRCKVTGAESDGLLLEQHDRFELMGFSGGPVVNAQGEVVGSVLGGRSPTIFISRVSSIRQRLAEAKVDLP
jgi:hypothetical protein